MKTNTILYIIAAALSILIAVYAFASAPANLLGGAMAVASFCWSISGLVVYRTGYKRIQHLEGTVEDLTKEKTMLSNDLDVSRGHVQALTYDNVNLAKDVENLTKQCRQLSDKLEGTGAATETPEPVQNAPAAKVTKKSGKKKATVNEIRETVKRTKKAAQEVNE